MRDRIVIVGLGQTGLSVARHLAARGQRFAVADSRSEPPLLPVFRAQFPDVPLHCGPFAEDQFVNADRLVLSPGLDPRQPALAAAVAAGVDRVGDIELFAEALTESRDTRSVVAITGSNGKSTVTTLLGELLAALGHRPAVGGNLGKPALDLLEDNTADCFVLELSSFQLETTRTLVPAVATVLNISEDHLDRYDSFEEYAFTKGRIAEHAGQFVANRDDRYSRQIAKAVSAPVSSFGLDAPEGENLGLVVRGDAEWLARGDQLLVPVSQLALAGRHNHANVLAALALLQALGYQDLMQAGIVETLLNFAGLPHRCRVVAEHGGVHWVDDSKATNVGAALAALAGMPAPVVLIAGGEGKGQDFSPLASAVASHARAVILIGRDAPMIERALAGVAVPVERAISLEMAVERAAERARPGDVVLLAPACASFDMFDSYAHRGECFAAAVSALVGERRA